MTIDQPEVRENLQDHCLTPISFKVVDLQVSGDVACESEVI